MTFFCGRRGQILELPYLMVVLFIFGVVSLLVFVVVSGFNSQIQASAEMPQESKDAMQKTTDTFGGAVDQGVIFLFIGFLVGMLVLAVMSAIHPVFFVFYFVMWVLTTLISMVLSDAWQDMTASAALSGYAAGLPFIGVVMSNLPVLILVGGSVVGAVAFKLRSGIQ